MKRLIIIAVLVVIVLLIIVYGTYYSMLNNLTWKFIGMNFSGADPDETGATGGLPSISDLKENTEVTLKVGNTSTMNFKITKFNLRIEDPSKNQVGAISTIEQILIPKNGEAVIPLTIKNLRVIKITTAFLSNDLKNYKYVVSGRLAGFVPFRYKGKIVY